MIAFDTSGSLTTAVASANSCGYAPNDRLAHGRCAVKQSVEAFAGEVNFGLSTFAVVENSCTGTCFNGCNYFCFPQEQTTTGNCFGCGPKTGNAATRAGAFIRVPMLQDHFWMGPPDVTNANQVIQWADNDCTNSVELFALGATPLNGMLRDMARYFGPTGWTAPDNSVSYPTPLSANDLAGAGVNGGTACRSVNVILITDGDETCDTQADAVAASTALYQTGVTVGGKVFKIPVYVINFAGGNQANTDAIAAAGGTTASYFATNEVQLSQALANIIGKSIKPETCDNTDNNCNGCTDEGFVHYCDVQPVAGNCCAWATAAQRTTCLNNYKASITAANPKGNLALLPCTTAAQQADPLNWLCFDPGEKCDNVDNNCSNGVDEGITKCGSPLHFPQTEVCNGQDDDCNGLIDEGGVCASCVPSSEICDGCDNNCNGQIDEGITSIPCGQPSPPNCAGVLTCKTIAGSFPPGTCVAGGGFNACNNNPQPEICDGLDNNCNGLVDDGIAPVACVPAGTPPGLVYGGTSQCKKGSQPCNGTCTGFVGPSTEICDGIDNDCDGVVDNNVAGAGQACGNSSPPCTPGVTACVGGALTCQGGVGPQPEKCDGVDNNCNGQIDEAPLADEPASGMNGCWANAGNCCQFPAVNPTLHWCPPAGASCNDNGTLTAPCNKGSLTCSGGAWTCQGPKGPSAEVCDGLDNNCNGAVDDGISQVGTTCGSNVGACKAGVYQCSGGVLSCVGSVGPTAETCDGVDNDCDGAVDNNVPGTGGPCGNSTPPCSPGVVACTGGALVCMGGVGPQPEVCDGVDNNCNGQVDEAPLADAPAQNGCWNLAGNCCSFANLNWCPPAGATCSGDGALSAPCAAGILTCGGVSGWSCQNPKGPSAEVCDGVDNNCDGAVDNVPPTVCVPAGTPAGLDFGPKSQCKMGTKTCGACMGFVGPSPEICDGIDNNCNGMVDEGVPGLGKACGINQPPCTPGTTSCVNGAIVCQGGMGPQPEICDGIDNNCNGMADEAPLADAPPPGMNGCWNTPGNCCSFANLSWCPPPGATCTGDGTLAAPCTQGSLACAGGSGWVCQGPKLPAPEACDGIDNDCNGKIDDGTIPQVGQACGANVGECKQGALACNVGVLTCVGAVGPTQETCDGKDNDCDGQIDNGIPVGGPCTPTYDMKLYPGNRDNLPCQPGILQCNGMGGFACVGGVGPQPEVCDGIDNDCDGLVDEVGAAPDGINGSANPLPPPAASIGDSCGNNQGQCKQGQYACVNGNFACLGGMGPTEESCDCQDNDCDGQVDNPNKNGTPLCSQGKSCVSSSVGCQCAAPCNVGEFMCPPGQKCEAVNDSQTGKPLGSYCVIDYDALCGDCTTKTVKDANAKVLCAPSGTMLPNCVTPPVCTCKGPNGCQEPCFGVTCAAGQVCASFGANAGKCVVDNCFNNGCQGCGKVCNLGACVDDPCQPASCPKDQECKPKPNFKGFDCVPSCAGVSCPSGQACKEGQCAPTCSPACSMGQVCDTTASPPACVAAKCQPNPCTDGSCCDPLTGACGNCPCEGILCPSGQTCSDGSCIAGQGGGGGGGGSTTSTTTSTTSATSSTSGGGTSASTGEPGTGGRAGGGGGDKPSGAWGLATGGGGCSCRVGDASGAGSSAALLALVACLALRRRRSRDALREKAVRQ
jgi:MYXO-CTERM domain-containing protein